jgi:hypothetical protein
MKKRKHFFLRVINQISLVEEFREIIVREIVFGRIFVSFITGVVSEA